MEKLKHFQQHRHDLLPSYLCWYEYQTNEQYGHMNLRKNQMLNLRLKISDEEPVTMIFSTDGIVVPHRTKS